MLEEDFDKDAEMAMKKATSQKQDKELRDLKVLERRHDREMPSRSLSYNVQHEASGSIFAVLLFMYSSKVLHSIHVLYYEFIGFAFFVF